MARRKTKKRTPRAKVVYRTKYKTRYRTLGASKKATPRRRRRAILARPRRARATMRKVNGSIFGSSFNTKNFLMKSAIGGLGGFGLKWGAEKVQEKLGIFDPWQKLGINLLLGVGAPILLRKNKKALSYILPASFVFTGASIMEAVQDNAPKMGLSGGTKVLGLNGGTRINKSLNGPTQIRERMAPSLSSTSDNF